MGVLDSHGELSLNFIQFDERFSVGIFVRGQLAWNDAEDPDVGENVVVSAFQATATHVMSTYVPCNKGYRLHCGPGRFQLYEKNIANTFIFLARGTEASGQDIVSSIAVQKISAVVQRVSQGFVISETNVLNSKLVASIEHLL